MRTALILLFALAVAAVPGSLVPQRPASPIARPRLRRRASAARPDLRRGRAVRRLQLGLVLGDLPVAVRLAGRLHHPAGRGVREGAPHAAAAHPAQPVPAARVRHRPAAADRDGRLLERAARRAAARALPGPDRGRLGRPPSAATCARPATWSSTSACCSCWSGVALGGLFGFRGTSVVIVGQGFANNSPSTTTSPAAAGSPTASSSRSRSPYGSSGWRFEIGDVQRGAARLFALDAEVTPDPGAAPRPTDHRGQPAAGGGRHDGAPDRPRLRAPGHGHRRAGRRRVLRAGGLPAAGRELHLGRRDQGPGRPAGAAGVRGHLRPDRRGRRSGTAVAVPRRAGPGALHQRLGRSAEGRDRCSRRTSTP